MRSSIYRVLLAAVLALSAGAAVADEFAGPVTATAAGGSTARTLADHFSDSLSAKDFGVTCDGSTDDSAAAQAAITAAIAANKALRFPAGTCRFNSTLTINGQIYIRGSGLDMTDLLINSTTLDLLNVTTDSPIVMEDLQLRGNSAATAGALLRLTGSGSGYNVRSRFDRILFYRGYDQFRSDNAGSWLITNSRFQTAKRYPVYVANGFAPDSGNGAITNSQFGAGQSGCTAIYQVSGGGLRVENNAILDCDYAYQLQLASGVATSDLLFIGNHIEQQAVKSMKFASDGGGATFKNIQIIGNEFSVTVPDNIDLNSGSNYITRAVISANIINIVGATGTGLTIGDITDFAVTANTFTGAAGATAVVLGSGATQGVVANNIIDGPGTRISNACTTCLVSDVNGTGVGIGSTGGPAASLHLAKAQSRSSWTTNGPALRDDGTTLTDTSSVAASTIALRTANSFGGHTFAASNAITITKPVENYFAAPAAGANVTFTEPGYAGYALAPWDFEDEAIFAEVAAPTVLSGYSHLWSDSTSHRFKMKNNGGAAQNVIGSGDTLASLASTTSAQLKTVLSNELDPSTSGLAIFSPGGLNVTTGKTLAATNNLTLSGTDSTTITFQGTDTYVGRATTDTLTNKTMGDALILKNYTVATLPTCSGKTYGFAAVSDATAPIYNGALTGGGSVKVPVFCDGTSWTSH